MSYWDTYLVLHKGHEVLVTLRHSGKHSAMMEIDECKERIRRGEATAIQLWAVSEEGRSYLKELRKYAAPFLLSS